MLLMIAARVVLPVIAVPVDKDRLGQRSNKNRGAVHQNVTVPLDGPFPQYTYDR
jgi:phosphoribosylcarboxyaminoimidazole (NCAIR) mutase